jgi:hypothetical protein
MTHKNRKKSRIFMFLSTGCALLRAEGFSCGLGVLYGGNFFLGHQTLDSDPQLEKMLDPDQNELSNSNYNPDFRCEIETSKFPGIYLQKKKIKCNL